MQPCVFSLINHAHPAATEFFDDTIVRNRLADHSCESLLVNRACERYGRNPMACGGTSQCVSLWPDDGAAIAATRLFGGSGRRIVWGRIPNGWSWSDLGEGFKKMTGALHAAHPSAANFPLRRANLELNRSRMGRTQVAGLLLGQSPKGHRVPHTIPPLYQARTIGRRALRRWTREHGSLITGVVGVARDGQAAETALPTDFSDFSDVRAEIWAAGWEAFAILARICVSAATARRYFAPVTL